MHLHLSLNPAEFDDVPKTGPVVVARPEPATSSILTCAALFLLGCVAFGYGNVHMPFGGIRFTQNLIMVPPVLGAERHTVAFDATADQTLQLIFAPTHPRPQDMPDEFTFDWAMTPARLGARPAIEGRVQFSGERFRARPNAPPLAVITLPEHFRGDYSIVVRPLEVGDWPDLEIFLVQASNKRFVGFTIAGIFWAMFLALSAVVYRRHRLAFQVWSRLVGPSGSTASVSSGVYQSAGQ